jgi:hypothetical protein
MSNDLRFEIEKLAHNWEPSSYTNELRALLARCPAPDPMTAACNFCKQEPCVCATAPPADLQEAIARARMISEFGEVHYLSKHQQMAIRTVCDYAERSVPAPAVDMEEHDAALKWEYGKEVWNLALRLAAGETWTPGLMNPELQQKMEQALERRLAQEYERGKQDALKKD